MVGGGGVGGLLIDGKYFAIKCYSDHWTFRSRWISAQVAANPTRR
jgi:hypothetical protein